MRINEIFLSIQGESSSQGLPTVFVRTTGCNLRCGYCDTEYAFYDGSAMSPEEVFAQVEGFGVNRVCLTGGEPLLQPPDELRRLLDLLDPYEVSIETGGSLPIVGYDLRDRHRWVMDIKCPSSGMSDRGDYGNIASLRPRDEVKFVVGDEGDYHWSVQVMERHRLPEHCRVLFSPVFGRMDPSLLAEWLLRDRVEGRLQVQLHKVLWGPRRRGV